MTKHWGLPFPVPGEPPVDKEISCAGGPPQPTKVSVYPVVGLPSKAPAGDSIRQLLMAGPGAPERIQDQNGGRLGEDLEEAERRRVKSEVQRPPPRVNAKDMVTVIPD